MKITTNHHEHKFVPVENTIHNVIKVMDMLDCTYLYNSKTGEVIGIEDLCKTVDVLSKFCHVDTMN